MPFCFKKSESPAKSVRRVGCGCVEVALDCLRRPVRPVAIHGARKEIKKLRALFRLLRGQIPADSYRKCVKSLRTAADCLAAPRDARVMLKAFETLTGKSASHFAGIGRALKKQALRRARQFRESDSLARSARQLRQTRRRLAVMPIKATDWSVVVSGVRQSYQRGRLASRLVRREATPENFHDWRKHVKDLWFYFCLLRPVWPAATRLAADEWELLGELLGEDHDLFLLQTFVATHCADHAKEAKTLNQLVVSRQKKLRMAALALGDRLYAEAPDGFCKRRPFLIGGRE